jgi:hypothetical protein
MIYLVFAHQDEAKQVPIGYDPEFPKEKLKNPKKVLRVYKKVLDEVPDKDLERLGQVLIKDFPNKTIDGKKYGTRGLFHRVGDFEYEIQVDPEAANERTIVVRRVMIHEIGHNVYYNLKAEEWAEWAQISNYMRESLPTSYARTNMREAWAECYMKYRMGQLAPSKRMKNPNTRAYRQFLYDRFEDILNRYEDPTYSLAEDTPSERSNKARELTLQGYKSLHYGLLRPYIDRAWEEAGRKNPWA